MNLNFSVALVWGTVVLSSMLPTTARANGCIVAERAEVLVSVKDPGPIITSSSSLQQINSKAKAHGLERHGKMVLGLTQSDVRVEMNFHTSIMVSADRTCVNIVRVEASFGHGLLKVILPREYARGTCQYKEVLKHEMEHVRVNREGIRKYATILKRDLQKAVRRLNPMEVRSQNQGKTKVERELKKVIKAVTKRFNSEIDAAHAIIDKPDGPYDSSNACRSW